MLKYGWKPGCISKSLLRKLNQAKIQNVDESEGIKRTRRTRKREEDKATLIIKKKSGQYTVEMQVEDKKEGNEHCKPLIYKIQRQDNEERIQRRERKAQRLISQTAKEVFTDPYHPQVCEQTCLKAFKQAMGVPPYNPNVPQCICPEDMEDEIEEIVSEESSDDESDDDLDLDWEIHFTPPISCHY